MEDCCIAVVVPAFKEQALLQETVDGIPDFVDHIVIVDDGSPDATHEVALETAESDPRVRVIRFGFNRGVGAAIVRGYRESLALDADIAVVMAGDNQMDPADLPAVVEPLVQGRADYVKGDRLSHRNAGDMPRRRRLGTLLLARLTGAIAGYHGLRDSQCGYTAIRTEWLEHLPLERLYPRYGYPNDLLIRLGERGARLAQPTVKPVYDREVSGLSIPAVIGPISGILLRGWLRRVR
jgi:glycosyltransferase involved in cell wall biosynthesis